MTSNRVLFFTRHVRAWPSLSYLILSYLMLWTNLWCYCSSVSRDVRRKTFLSDLILSYLVLSYLMLSQYCCPFLRDLSKNVTCLVLSCLVRACLLFFLPSSLSLSYLVLSFVLLISLCLCRVMLRRGALCRVGVFGLAAFWSSIGLSFCCAGCCVALRCVVLCRVVMFGFVAFCLWGSFGVTFGRLGACLGSFLVILGLVLGVLGPLGASLGVLGVS